MIGFLENIEELALQNAYFRRVLYTGKHTQLVLMSLLPGEEIGMEVHEKEDQFLRFEAGEGKVVINEEEYTVKDGGAVVVPAGTKHNVVNTSEEKPLKLYTLYSPPHHKVGTIHKTKQEAEADE